MDHELNLIRIKFCSNLQTIYCQSRVTTIDVSIFLLQQRQLQIAPSIYRKRYDETECATYILVSAEYRQVVFMHFARSSITTDSDSVQLAARNRDRIIFTSALRSREDVSYHPARREFRFRAVDPAARKPISLRCAATRKSRDYERAGADPRAVRTTSRTRRRK